VDAGVVVAVDDWPCAASSVLIVAGESWEKPLLPVAGVELAEVVAVLATSNGFVEAESKPVAGGVYVICVRVAGQKLPAVFKLAVVR